MNHVCAQAGCDEAATHVVIESHHLALLFKQGAGLCCEKHARAMEQVGGVGFSVADELAPVLRERESESPGAGT